VVTPSVHTVTVAAAFDVVVSRFVVPMHGKNVATAEVQPMMATPAAGSLALTQGEKPVYATRIDYQGLDRSAFGGTTLNAPIVPTEPMVISYHDDGKPGTTYPYTIALVLTYE